MNRSVRLSWAVLAVAALSCAACSSTPPPNVKAAGSSSVAAGSQGATTASPNSSLFEKTLHIGAKTDQPGLNVNFPGKHDSSGFESDLGRYLGDKLGFTARFDDVPSVDRETRLLDDSEKLVIATYSITPERLQKIDFVGPYMQTRQGLLVRKGYKEIKTRADTAHKQICTVRGSTSAPEGDNWDSEKDNPLDQNANFVPELDYSACVKRLIQKNVDAVWTDKLILYGFAHDNPQVEVLDNIDVGKNQLYGIGIKKNQPAQCKALEAELKNFMNNNWLTVFNARFPDLVATDNDFEANYKPRDGEIDRQTSCA